MHSIFLKIFIWFWLASALVVTALFLTTEMTTQRRTFLPREAISSVEIYAATAARIYEREGVDQTSLYLATIRQKTNVKAVLLDENENSLTNRDATDFPDFVNSLIEQAKQTNITATKMIDAERYFAAVTETPAGRRLIFIATMPPPSFPQPSFQTQIWRLLAVLLTAGIVCYWLASYIAAPVAKIRHVTRRLSEGDLKARVAPALGKRRDELADMGRDFDQMAERIESLMDAQWRLLGDISHELRSPLARLNIALGLARQKIGAMANGSLDRIEQEAVQMNEMIGQLLELDRWQFGERNLPREVVNLAELIQQIADDADFEARSQNRCVRFVHAEDCLVECFPQLLRSAIENVVRNAVRHTDQDTSVEISLDCVFQKSVSQAVITVRDNGSGVPEDSIDHIFKPFYRVDEARDRASGGAGLGLAITERSINLHRGSVVAANAPVKGLIVQILLPALAESMISSKSKFRF